MTNVIYTYLDKLVYKTEMGSSSLLKIITFQHAFKHLRNKTDFCSLVMFFQR